MGQRYNEIPQKVMTFIQNQKVFFVGTAAADGRVNISPKGMDSLRVIDSQRVLWLNVTGSGNETAAHVAELPRMTLMFCAFEGNPMILRLYGTARVIHTYDEEWERLYPLFNPTPGVRQIFDLSVDLVQTSCGMGVPFYDYAGERDQLMAWTVKKGDEGIRDYWQEKNQQSLDGKPTFIFKPDNR
ncbi:MAG: pyridoxamine 5'-phosphate oxidase family protein [Sedimenticola thiotaurini]|uniref:Pyridoxamine 5'-phosphate oxidase family protein n=1 Tax=Sedimenticola thiotaurini TaxID=1543721 RepID=A0A558D2Z1_9GAMM|nr:MAG: pyridoxamine 5'-phosphate oxidase family protein [Sedimenticola thiotaurini]